MDKKLEQAVESLQQVEQKANSTAQAKVAVGTVTPDLMKKAAPKVVKPEKRVVLSEEAEKLCEFIKQTGALYKENENTPYEKCFATYPAWQYLGALNGASVIIKETSRFDDPTDKNAMVVRAEGVLVDTYDQDHILARATAIATTSEAWLKDKPFSAAYGLAQTRLEERLLRMAFGYQLTLAHLEPTGAEELSIDSAKYGTKDKEI